MFSQQWLTRIVLATTAVLSLSACASNVQRLASPPTPTEGLTVSATPMPTLFAFPVKDILPSPTLTAGKPFDCWAASGPEIPTYDGLGQLLVAYRIDRSSTSNLYRFDFATQKYVLVTSHIEAYEPSPDGLKTWYSFYQATKRSMEDVIFVHDLVRDTHHQVPFPIRIDSKIERLAWSPDSQCLFAWRDDTAFAYRLKDGALQSKAFPGVNFGFDPRAVSPDGRWWAWDCEKDFHPLNPHEQKFCLLSPQGQQVDHAGLHLPVTTERGSGFSVRSLGWWSPDSRMLAIAYPGHRSDFQDAIRLVYVDETSVSTFQDIELKEGLILRSLLWSPDSHQLLILNSTYKLYIYRPATKEMITVPTPDGNYVKAAAWSPDGKQIAIVTENKQYKTGLYTMNADGTDASSIPLLPQEAEGAELVAPDYAIDQAYWVP